MSKKMVNRGYKFRLYPNAEQRELINKTIGCARYIYNYGLDLKTSAYKKDKTNLTENDIKKMVTAHKKEDEFLWLQEVDSIALQAATEELFVAFDHFFNDGFGYPRFKSKKRDKNSYTTKSLKGAIKIVNNAIKLPKLGWVKLALSKQVDGEINNPWSKDQWVCSSSFCEKTFELLNV